MTEIDGLDIHFLHIRSEHEDALPLIVTHGWPGSIVEQLKIIEPLTNPTAHGGERVGRLPSRDPVAAGTRVLGQADGHRVGSRPHRARLGDADEAPRIHAVRGAGRRLGRGGHADDGDPGALRSCSASTPTCRAPLPPDIHAAILRGDPPPADLSGDERRAYDQLIGFYAKHVAYAQIMSTRPQTLYGLADSPVDLAAFAIDHGDGTGQPGLIAKIVRGRAAGRPDARRHPRQHHALLADEHRRLGGSPLLGEQGRASSTPSTITIPFAISVFPDELYQAPRSWAEQAYPDNLIHFNELDRGGHFAAWEQPQLFSQEMRAAFRSLR